MSTPPTKTLPPSRYFPKVKQAREAIQVRAYEIVKLYMANIKKAMKAGEYEVAAKSLQWLMEHMPKDENGIAIIEASIDKPSQSQFSTSPSIQIGFNLGGISPQKELPPPDISIIDISENE